MNHNEAFAMDCEGYGGAPAWLPNTGERPPLKRVDIMLNEDEKGAPGVPMVRFNVNPADWDWQRHGLQITHYRPSFS